MAAWITVYLHGAVPELRPEALQEGISDADWWTLGEELELEEPEVDRFLAELRWSAAPLELRVEGRRPIQLHVWTDPARVRDELDELDQIAGLQMPAAVRTHLGAVRSIVALELGFSQLGTMFEVVGFEIAYWLAESYGGVIRGPNDAWFDHDAHRWDPIV